MTREEAIDLLDNLIGTVEDNHNSDYDTAIKIAIDSLKQEPKTGKWTDTGTEEEWYGISFECSECKGNMVNSADFCPWCGAKMIETIWR